MADTDGDGGVNTSDLHPLAEYLVGNAAPILLAGISAWFVLFALFEKLVRVLTAKSGLVREATPTTPPGEKPTTVQGFAFLALSTLHSTTVATLVLSTFPALVFPGPVETGTGGSIGTAGSESELASDSPGLYSNLKFGVVDGELQAVAFTAGFVYTSWALFEVLFFTLHWRVFGKFSDMFHHVLFSAAGLFFMSNQYTCGFYAVVLMGMETSTPWLNLHLAFRGSSGATRRVLGKAAGIVYFVTMACFRIVIPAFAFLQFVVALTTGTTIVSGDGGEGGGGGGGEGGREGGAGGGKVVLPDSPYFAQIAVLGTAQLLSLGLQLFWLTAIVSRICRSANDPEAVKERIRRKRAAVLARSAAGGATPLPTPTAAATERRRKQA